MSQVKLGIINLQKNEAMKDQVEAYGREINALVSGLKEQIRDENLKNTYTYVNANLRIILQLQFCLNLSIIIR